MFLSENRKNLHGDQEWHFSIKMREDELPLLEKVKDFFSCGRISFQKEYRENQRDNYRYQVSNLQELNAVIVPFFRERYLHSTPRRKDFELFSKILKLVNDKKHKTGGGLKRIQKLKSRMHN